MNGYNTTYQPVIPWIQTISRELPDGLRVTLFPDGTLSMMRGWHPWSSPIVFLHHLSPEETKLCERLLHFYPRVSPLHELFSPHLRGRIAKQRLYGTVTTLRNKLTESGLLPVPVTGEGYVLAISSSQGHTSLKHYPLNEQQGITLSPYAALAALWQQDALLHCQHFSRLQMRLLQDILEEYPHYCSYERLYAERVHLPYEPAAVARLLEQHPQQKYRIHSIINLFRKRLCQLGLCLENYEEIGYQLISKQGDRREQASSSCHA